jgi:hypothetical protein
MMQKNNNSDFEEYSHAVLIGAGAFITFIAAILVESALDAKKEKPVKNIRVVSSHTQPKLSKGIVLKLKENKSFTK